MAERRNSNGIASMIQEEWDKDEEQEPTNPYRILYIGGDSEHRTNITEDDINAALAARKEKLDPDSKHNGVIESRLERAAAFLSDWETKDDYDTKLLERKENKTWGILKYNNGVYEGFIKEGSWAKKKPIRHGRGITTTVDGERYEGSYQEGKRHGFGWQFWVNGDFYRGQWKRDAMQGSGQYFYSNGDVYTGLFADNAPQHNQGCLEFANGDVYIGDFVHGMRSGKGKLTSAKDGGVYNGAWLDGKEHGNGEFTCANGNSYKGQYEEGLFHGQGVQQFPDGDHFTCDFVHGRADGEGVYTWGNGDKYEGQFRLGQRCGEGTFTGSLAQYKGEWNDGVPEGTGEMKRAIGPSQGKRSSAKEHKSSKKRSSKKEESINQEYRDEYTGQWEGGLKEGQGTMTYPSGHTYSGAFRGDRKHGRGTFTWNTGNLWIGDFWLDVQHGSGNYTVYSSGSPSKKKNADTSGRKTSVGESVRAQVGNHRDLYHHGLLCERDGLPVKAPSQEDPLEGPRASRRGTMLSVKQMDMANANDS